MTHDELLARIDEEGEFQVQYFDTKPKMISALRAVVELHKPIQGNTLVLCRACMDSRPMGAPVIVYPCRTIQAIERELR